MNMSPYELRCQVNENSLACKRHYNSIFSLVAVIIQYNSIENGILSKHFIDTYHYIKILSFANGSEIPSKADLIRFLKGAAIFVV